MLRRDSPYSWRAGAAFVLVLAVATGLVLHGDLSGAEWSSAVQWCAGFFISGEAARKFAGPTASTPAAGAGGES